MDNRIKGLGTALVTPFTEDGRVDYDGLGKLIDYQIDNGVDFLCVLGTTGEAATLSADEKEGVIDYSIERIGRRVPILLGCSSNNTVDLGKEISRYSRYDVDAMLSVVPFYNKPTQEGIVKHYEYISGCTDKGLVMRTDTACRLERAPEKFRQSSSSHTPEERLRMAQDYLDAHPFMTIDDYCALTGLLRYTASRELKQWKDDPATGITTSGRGTHKVYVKR